MLFSGSDTTSYFYTISKNGWWKVWVENSFITKTFIKLSWTPECVEEVDLHEIEKFVSLAYDPQNRMKVNDVNRLRRMMFQKSSENNLRKLPPTKDSLKMHVLRSAYACRVDVGIHSSRKDMYSICY